MAVNLLCLLNLKNRAISVIIHTDPACILLVEIFGIKMDDTVQRVQPQNLYKHPTQTKAGVALIPHKTYIAT